MNSATGLSRNSAPPDGPPGQTDAATGIDFLTGGALIEKKYSLYLKPGISLYGCDDFARGIRGTTGEEKEGKEMTNRISRMRIDTMNKALDSPHLETDGALHGEQCLARPRDSLLACFLILSTPPSQQGNASTGHYPIGNVPKGLLHLIDKNEA